MAFCPNCGYSYPDGVNVCPNCGTVVAQNNGMPQQNIVPNYGYAAYKANPADHTAEFDPADISENKVIALAAYLMGIFGIIIALLAAPNSRYAAFHSRQVLKFEIVTILMWIVAGLTCWLLFIPVILAGIASVVLYVIRIICFFQVCKGKAIEAPVIRSLGFLK